MTLSVLQSRFISETFLMGNKKILFLRHRSCLQSFSHIKFGRTEVELPRSAALKPLWHVASLESPAGWSTEKQPPPSSPPPYT